MFFLIKKISFSCSIFLLTMTALTILFLPVNSTHAQIAFGGSILFIDYCDYGGTAFFLGPPSAGTYMSYAGESQYYLNGEPSHIGQWVLGEDAGIQFCYHPACDGEDCPVYSGSLILYAGTSN